MHNTAATTHPDLIVGIAGSDDAGVYRIDDDRAMVQTVDFFTPIVDDAYDWGRIAAANALSDVYAMGGDPITALQLVGWPRDDLPFDLLSRVIEGGVSVMVEAGCTVIGGHSIDDREPKYGFAVTGYVPTDEIMTNAAGEPGQVLVLTKPIGTGIIATAIKNQKASSEITATAIDIMATLNRDAADAARRVGVKAATDVTGFGLLGHLSEIVRASGVSAEIEVDAVPLIDGVTQMVEDGMIPGGTRRNLKSVLSMCDFGELDRNAQLLLADAQTSGGLLLCVDAPLEQALHAALADNGVSAWTIGSLTERPFEHGPSGRITVR
jgi:selenide,water dikinase